MFILCIYSETPPSSTILAVTIGATFVAPRNLPQKTMPSFLHANQNRVHDVLLWLKQNNTIYRDIAISSTRLLNLPVDGVPLEISATANHCDDTFILYCATSRNC